jgi:hypothetical protein
MTPKEKAEDLILKFRPLMLRGQAINSALICVNEIEAALIDCGELSDQLQNMDRELNFWQNVRKEIEILEY